MQGPGEYFFVRNNTDQEIITVHDRAGYSAPAGGLFRPQGAPDDKATQFERGDAALLMNNLPVHLRDHCETVREMKTISKKEQTPASPPRHRAVVKNAPDKDYPDGVPEMNWSRAQCLAYLKENSAALFDKVRLTTSVETMVLAVWKEIDPPRYDSYMKATGGE